MATKRANQLGAEVRSILTEIYGETKKIPAEVADYAAKQAELLVLSAAHPSFPDAAQAAAEAVALYAGIKAVRAGDAVDQRAYAAILGALRVGVALL